MPSAFCWYTMLLQPDRAGFRPDYAQVTSSMSIKSSGRLTPNSCFAVFKEAFAYVPHASGSLWRNLECNSHTGHMALWHSMKRYAQVVQKGSPLLSSGMLINGRLTLCAQNGMDAATL